ncbi:hypothetical protein RchiOBHm_Chr6g0286811 [Rosa chinensis]|uniref:Uncharacterized protein n=1 Tax=Rosa chinensis TaxID=74649 RepID=A0A2P6PV02_ROSCH|nr:hypothetical protein RchiOBHm_Chr6g0286811 [Rosa chinensis]
MDAAGVQSDASAAHGVGIVLGKEESSRRRAIRRPSMDGDIHQGPTRFPTPIPSTQKSAAPLNWAKLNCMSFSCNQMPTWWFLILKSSLFSSEVGSSHFVC